LIKEHTSPFSGAEYCPCKVARELGQSAETENANPIKIGATTLAHQKVDISPGSGENVF